MTKKTTLTLATTLILLPLLMLKANDTFADNSAIGELSKQLPDLLNMIQERQEHLRRALNRDGNDYQTYSDEQDITPSFSTSDTESTNAGFISSILQNAFQDGLRDPFSITKDIAKFNNKNYDNPSQPSLTATPVDRIPKLKLRGVIMHDQDSSPLALLDIAGDGVHMVRVGDRISFSAANPLQVIEIKQINRLNVIVEIGTLGDLVVVR